MQHRRLAPERRIRCCCRTFLVSGVSILGFRRRQPLVNLLSYFRPSLPLSPLCVLLIKPKYLILRHGWLLLFSTYSVTTSFSSSKHIVLVYVYSCKAVWSLYNAGMCLRRKYQHHAAASQHYCYYSVYSHYYYTMEH